MMKCEDCPLNTATLKNEVYCYPVDIVARPGLHELCKLTRRDVTIIKAMIAGIYDCGHCTVMIDFSGQPTPLPCPVREDAPKGWPCEGWQPKEDER